MTRGLGVRKSPQSGRESACVVLALPGDLFLLLALRWPLSLPHQRPGQSGCSFGWVSEESVGRHNGACGRAMGLWDPPMIRSRRQCGGTVLVLGQPGYGGPSDVRHWPGLIELLSI